MRIEWYFFRGLQGQRLESFEFISREEVSVRRVEVCECRGIIGSHGARLNYMPSFVCPQLGESFDSLLGCRRRIASTSDHWILINLMFCYLADASSTARPSLIPPDSLGCLECTVISMSSAKAIARPARSPHAPIPSIEDVPPPVPSPGTLEAIVALFGEDLADWRTVCGATRLVRVATIASTVPGTGGGTPSSPFVVDACARSFRAI